MLLLFMLFSLCCLAFEFSVRRNLVLIESVLMAVVLLVFWCLIMILFVFHLNLLRLNHTTNEHMKRTTIKWPSNPFSVS